MYYVYFLKSQKDSRYYIGYTSKIPERRLAEHNAGMVTSTKFRRPFNLVYLESFTDHKQAYKREWYLKHSRGYQEKLKIIARLDL